MEKVGIYVLYHDEASKEIAKIKYSKDFPMVFYHKLDDSCVLESSFYLHDLKTMNHDWIGALSYNAFNKFPSCNLKEFLHLVSIGKTSDLDVAAFFNPMPDKSFQHQMKEAHPGLFEIFRDLIIAMGEDHDVLESAPITAFYSNLWVAKKEMVAGYCDWLQKVWKVIQSTPALAKALNQYSNYREWDHDPEILQRFFKLPYTPYYPFLFERLPCYYFYSRNARVKMIMDCKPSPCTKDKIGIYVLYHDERSYQIARNSYAERFPHFTFHKLSDSPILESSFYMNDLEKIDTCQYEWIGTFTYRAIGDKFPPEDITFFHTLIEINVDEFDVMGFFNPFPTESLKLQMTRCHPGLYEIFRDLLIAMNEDVGLLDSNKIPVFYANLWVARKSLALAYSQWLQAVWKTIESTPHLKEALCQRSNYPHWDNRPQLLQRIFHLPYMPQHPFLFERLPCYFFCSRNARIRMARS